MLKLQKSIDKKLTEELYKKYAHKVYSKCLKMTKSPDDAYDLAQEVWMKVQKSISKFKHKSNPSTWIYSIAHNHCIDFLRKRNRRNLFHSSYRTELEGKSTTELPGHLQDKAELIREEKMFELLRSVSDDSKLKILWLKYGKDMSVKEIALEMGLTNSAVKMRLQRARIALRKQLEAKLPKSMVPQTRKNRG